MCYIIISALSVTAVAVNPSVSCHLASEGWLLALGAHWFTLCDPAASCHVLACEESLYIYIYISVVQACRRRGSAIMQGSQGERRPKVGCVTAQIPPEELEFRGDPDNRKDVMANRKRIQARPHPDWLSSSVKALLQASCAPSHCHSGSAPDTSHYLPPGLWLPCLHTSSQSLSPGL